MKHKSSVRRRACGWGEGFGEHTTLFKIEMASIEANKSGIQYKICFQICDKELKTQREKTEQPIRQHCNIITYIIASIKQIVGWKDKMVRLRTWPDIEVGSGFLFFNPSEEK